MGLFGKKYKCSTCGAKFKTEAEMMEHGRMHTNQAAPKSAGSRQVARRTSFPSETSSTA